MNSIKNIELLPKFFNEVKSMCGEAKLSDGRLIVALMSDLLPEADELKRCIKMVYESGAITHILEISKDSSNLQLYKNKALDRVINNSFMDKQIATSVIDAVVAAVYPEIKSSSSADEQHLLGNNCFAKQDYVQAVEHFRKAAEQNHAAAQNDLGFCYQNGLGVNKDYYKAFYWYSKSAEQGFTVAQCNLGGCYENGNGTVKDLVKAEYWYGKSAKADPFAALALERVRAAMNSGQFNNDSNIFGNYVDNHNYVVIDNVTGEPVDMSRYEITIDPAVMESLSVLKQGVNSDADWLIDDDTNETIDNETENRKKTLASQLITVLKNKLRKDLDEQLYIYRLMQLTPPEVYVQIRSKL